MTSRVPGPGSRIPGRRFPELVGERREWTLLVWGLAASAAAVSLAGMPGPAFLARLFFVVVFLGGAVAVAGRFGPRPQLAVAALALLLVLVQRAVSRPVLEPPSSQWTRSIAGPEQVIEHTIELPLAEPSWSRAWARAADAALFVCARGPLTPEDGLQLSLNGEPLGLLTEGLAFGPRPGPTFVGFYRLPVDRAVLERQARAAVELRRLPGATPRPIPVCGTFTYRPTAGLDSSRLFDGAAWWHPGLTQQGRFVIELRLEDAAQRAVLALY